MSLVDVVNFNADASCLSAEKWLYCLKGGKRSLFYQALENYVSYNRKVNLGLTGATIRDVVHFNPEAIDLINKHPQVFELICRPFAHDSPLLRTNDGFKINLQKGLQIIRNTFHQVNDFYLAPELMKSGQQVKILQDLGIKGIFIHKDRFAKEIFRQIPDEPHFIKGVLGARLPCLPFNQKKESKIFLDVLHGYLAPEEWIRILEQRKADYYFWRDGESCLLFPMGVKFEARLLAAEELGGIKRRHLSELNIVKLLEFEKNEIMSYPYHSLQPWFKDMKMYWLASRIRDYEKKLKEYPDIVQTFWMLLINSDIMASAEKDSPVIRVSEEVFSVNDNSPQWTGVARDPRTNKLTLKRCDRGVEGEDYLAYLELLLEHKSSANQILAAWRDSNEPHLLKAHARVVPDVQKGGSNGFVTTVDDYDFVEDVQVII